MSPEKLPQLLSQENRTAASDLGLTVAAEDAGGAVIYGCPLSGRFEFAQHAAVELPVEREHWVVIDVSTSPRQPEDFFQHLGNRILERVKAVAPLEVVQRLQGIAHQQALFLRQEALRDALRELRPVARLVLFFKHLDAVETTHIELDSCFEALRDILPEAGVYCFVTSYKDLRKSLTGVSHFANNFTTRQPHPVSLGDVASAWRDTSLLASDEAANLVVREYGFAEYRVQKGLRLLESLVKRQRDDLANLLKFSACADLAREAQKFWERLDTHSQQVLQRSLMGLDNPPEHVSLILRHDWARYSLRPYSNSKERVEIFDSPLRAHVEGERIKQMALKAANSSELRFDRVVRLIREGNPAVALELLHAVEDGDALGEGKRQSVNRLKGVAHALEGAINADYKQAIAGLESLGDGLDDEARALVDFWKKVVRIEDLPRFYDKESKSLILDRLALEFARARRRERLQRWADAFKDFMVVIESATQAQLTKRGWRKGQPLPQDARPSDALSQYQEDARRCGRDRDRLPTALPDELHGGLEMILACRALDLSGMRTLRMDELNNAFTLRTRVNHAPAIVNQEKVVHARELASQVLELTARGWGLSVPDGDRFLWPDQLVAAQLQP
ncbi:hypothetical protein BO221_11720 [Archangium sp. Cb G35]|uniref:hypothetical protein n=1 Tax=Archangium sp. Cb G35 TaxID=1920190 RepID=UPI000936E7B9|nr:hypothetical protein [Archangium sp. Cb G35]OJT25044.1 hypothetical protein BO221_11720 [Archangium sp. Cb G35]